MGRLRDKFKRGLEAVNLLLRYAGDGPSRRALTACYREMLKTSNSPEEIHLTLKIAGRRFPFAMRKSDIFTLAEILHEGQYDLESELPASPVIVDAGANIGVSPIWFLAKHPGAKIHCFEPEETNFRLLTENLGATEGVHLVRAALANEVGEVELHLSDHGAMHSIVDEEAGPSTQRVPLMRLDGYLEEHGVKSVDLLKLDVEGSELDLLVGLDDRLADVQVVAGEVHETLISTEAFYAHLERYGFKVLWKRYYGNGREEGVHMFEAARS